MLAFFDSCASQLDMERDSSARESRRSSPRASSTAAKESMHAEVLNKELQALSDVKVRLEEENLGLKRKVMDLEDSNNALRKQLVDTRRYPMSVLCTDGEDAPW